MQSPLVTFALFSFNHEEYVRAAVEAALAQTYRPMEIILSDDASTDRSYAIMEEIVAAYQGPHQVILRRNASNLGLADHLNTIFAMASGEFIIVAAGDDISLPWRTEVMVEHFLANPDCVLLGSYSQCFGIHTHIAPLLEDRDSKDLVTRCKMMYEGIQGATFAYRKTLIERFPTLESATQAEDNVFAFRAWEIGTFELVPEVLILYRTHVRSLAHTTHRHDTIAYQVKMHSSVIDQLCLDLKRCGRSFAEIAPALALLRKHELELLRGLGWHKNGSMLDKVRIFWNISKVRKLFLQCPLPKRIRRHFERKARIKLVQAKWQEVLDATEGPRALPKHLKSLIQTQ